MKTSLDRVHNIGTVCPSLGVYTAITFQGALYLPQVVQRGRLRHVVKLRFRIPADHRDQAIDVFELQILPIGIHATRHIIAENCIGKILDNATQPVLIAVLS